MSNKDSILSKDKASLTADFFSAFSDSTRLRIISTLIDGELNVQAISEEIGISESATSHQLRNLRQLRLVKTRREGRCVFYCLDDAHIIEIFNAGVKHVQHD